jgi:hypothetical protein
MKEKMYNVMFSIGRAKYVVNYHDGVKTHGDGSRFFDMAIFRNKVDLNNFIDALERNNYKKV